jgi:flagellar transcriptional activator FlhC
VPTPSRADRHVGAILLAQQCAELGARCRTIHLITGLKPRELQWLFFSDPQATPRGRAPDSPEWYHSANLLHRAEASIFSSVYKRLRSSGFAAGEALVNAYRSYQSICQCPYRISFDRAFDIASHTDGIWLAKCPAFSVVTCPACNSQFLAAFGTMACSNNDCPFCRLVQRFGTDQRLQRCFPTHAPHTHAAPMHTDLMAQLCHEEHGADGDSGPQ